VSTAADGRWHPGIGDPNLTGWVTVLAYGVAFALCALCAAREPAGAPAAEPARRVWIAVALLMALLGVNKQLDLQTWFTEVGRDMAMAQGWYAARQKVQVLFIGVLGVAGVIAMAWLQHVLRRLGSEVRGVVAGLVVLMVFVVTRAASFHHVDRLLSLELAPHVRFNAVLELSGIGLVIGAALRRLTRLSHQRPTGT
jgi:hypothetical protein